MRNKSFFSILLSCFIGFISFAQTSTIIDSLKQQLLLEKSEVKKCSIYNDLVRNYIYNSPKTSLKYNDSLADLSNEIEHEELKMQSLFNYARINRVLGDYQKALDILVKYKVYVKKKKDTSNLIPTYYQMGVSNMFLDNRIDAINYLLKSLELSETINNEESALMNLNAIGAIYDQMAQYEKALDYYKRVEKSYLKTKDPDNLGLIYSNLGIVYKHMDSLDIALDYFEKGYDLSKNRNNLSVKSYQLRNIGLIHQTKRNFEKAEKNFLKALDIRIKMGEKLPLLGSYYDLGSLYNFRGDTSNAILNLKKALAISKEIKSESNEALCLIALSEVYKNSGNIFNAYRYLKEGKLLNDSIQSTELKERVNELDKKYQTEKKDKEIASQQLAIQQKEVEIQKKKTQNNYMLGSVIFLSITALMLVFLLKQRQKRKKQELLALKREFQIKTLESLIEGEEKERHRVAKELHDGVNGDLAAIKYKLSSLLEMNNSVIKEAISMIDDSCKQVRAISHNLIPPSLENFNLLEATEVYCNNLNDLTKELEITFQHLGDGISLPKKAEVNAFRIIQELVTNAIRHAEASQIDVQISSRDATVQITVEDNGKGFDKNTIKSDGIGLSNIQSRVDYLNATTDFMSNNQGTSYTIDIDKDKVNGN